MIYSSSQSFRDSPLFSSVQSLSKSTEWPNRLYNLASAIPTLRYGLVQQIVDEDEHTLVSRVELQVRQYVSV